MLGVAPTERDYPSTAISLQQWVAKTDGKLLEQRNDEATHMTLYEATQNTKHLWRPREAISPCLRREVGCTTLLGWLRQEGPSIVIFGTRKTLATALSLTGAT